MNDGIIAFGRRRGEIPCCGNCGYPLDDKKTHSREDICVDCGRPISKTIF